MTVSMEHKTKGKRKGSWDSKMSVSSMNTRHRSNTPSSILSSDSDIRFTRKLGGQYRCGCWIVAGFLFLLLGVAAAVYLGYTFLSGEPPEDRVFQATFRVVEGDAFLPSLADPSTEDFRRRARDYRERLNLVLRRSELRTGFVGSEVLALDGEEGRDLVVHSSLRFDPRWLRVEAADLVDVLAREILLEESPYLANLTIDPDSLDVKESTDALTTSLPVTSQPEETTPLATTSPPPPRKCGRIGLEYCSALPYNVTSYPNKLGHRSLREVREDVIAFRELVDAECSRLAYHFVCRVLQPGCEPSTPEDRIVLPCRSFCREFHAGCGDRVPERFRAALDCATFPESGCHPKPGCVKELQSRALSSRVCDGVPDCEDLSDETSCDYCPPGHLHCGSARSCVAPERRCDGRRDCPDGSDEHSCLTIAPNLTSLAHMMPTTPHQTEYFSEGYVVFNEKGETGKVCASGMDVVGALKTVAASLCNALSFRNVNVARAQSDNEPSARYVTVADPQASEMSFVRAPCEAREVLYVGCSDPACGRQTLRTTPGVEGLQKTAAHGDWPWHASLFRDGSHVCDATLVAPDWLLTSSSCFQGQPKAAWLARLGAVRLSSSALWQQQRAVVGLVRSPVEGSTVVLARLARPTALSDFVRPACLPAAGSAPFPAGARCNTLGWARNREMLQRIEVRPGAMQNCENISIPTVNSFCTEPAFLKDDCNEEELAGSPVLCLMPDNVTWTVVGVSNWRIACSKLGTERPRMYDKITSNVEWIEKTISETMTSS